MKENIKRSDGRSINSFYVDNGISYQQVDIRNYNNKGYSPIWLHSKENAFRLRFRRPFVEWKADPFPYWTISRWCTLRGSEGRIIGSMTALMTDFDPHHPHHSWDEVTDNGYIGTHQTLEPLYVVDISVSPHYRKTRTSESGWCSPCLNWRFKRAQAAHWRRTDSPLSQVGWRNGRPNSMFQAVLDGKTRSRALIPAPVRTIAVCVIPATFKMR